MAVVFYVKCDQNWVLQIVHHKVNKHLTQLMFSWILVMEILLTRIILPRYAQSACCHKGGDEPTTSYPFKEGKWLWKGTLTFEHLHHQFHFIKSHRFSFHFFSNNYFRLKIIDNNFMFLPPMLNRYKLTCLLVIQVLPSLNLNTFCDGSS